MSAGGAGLRFEGQQHAVKAQTEPTTRVQIGQTKEVEEFVRPTAQHLAFATEFFHLDFEHHAGVVVEASGHGQVNSEGRGGRCQRSEGRERRFQFVQRLQGNTVHAGEQFTSRFQRFHPAVEGGEGAEWFGVGRVETVA